MNVIELIKALSGFAWPLLAGIAFVVIYPVLRNVLKSRAFTFKVGNTELSVQQGVDGIQAAINDLRQQIIALQEQRSAPRAMAAGATTATSAEVIALPESATTKPIRRILWVDDEPSNNAFYVAALKDKGIEVEQALSTREAIAKLQSATCDAIVSDMGRNEEGKWRDRAGMTLLRALQRSQLSIPFMFFTSSATATPGFKKLAAEAGAKIMTSSGTELFRCLRENGASI